MAGASGRHPHPRAGEALRRPRRRPLARPRRPPGRGVRPARPQRCGQDHDHPDAAGAHRADRRHAPRSWASTRRATRSRSSGTSATCRTTSGFYGGMTGRENLRYTAPPQRHRRQRVAEARIDELLDRVGLPRRRRPTAWRRTRAACASASASPTRWSRSRRCVILDEPTTSIDPVGVVGGPGAGARARPRPGRRGAALEPPAPPGAAGLRPHRHLRGGRRRRDGHRRRARGPPAARRQRRARDRRRRRPATTSRPSCARCPGVVSVERDPTDPRLWSVTGRAGRARRDAVRRSSAPGTSPGWCVTGAWSWTRSTSATSRQRRPAAEVAA